MTEIAVHQVATPSRTPPASQGTLIEQTRAAAEVEAAFIVAQRYHRDVQDAIVEMRAACQTTWLAERAFFRFPRGGTMISGRSIHLARELARIWGNFAYGITELSRDDEAGRSEMMASASDLQKNTRNWSTFIQPHIRDRQDGPVRLTDQRDIYESNANAGARRVREAIFATLPAWFADEAAALCTKTIEDGGGKPLPQRIAEAIRLFGELGVTAGQLEAKIGRPSGEWIPHDVAQIGVIYRSLRAGEINKEDEFPDTRIRNEDITAVPAKRDPATDELGFSTRRGSVKGEQQDRLWALLSDRFEFTKDTRDQSRAACEALIGRKLTGGTTGNLSESEAEDLIGQLDELETRADLTARLAELAQAKDGDADGS